MTDLNLLGGLEMAALLCVAACAAFVATRQHRDTYKFQIALFLAAFAIRFAVSIALYQGGLIAWFGDEDGSGWVVGRTLQQQWQQYFSLSDTLQVAFLSNNRGYDFLLGLAFSTTGLVGRLPATAINACLAGLAVVLAYRAARGVASERAARWVGWGLCLFPSLIIWSAFSIKEALVFFLEALALYACLQINRGRSAARYFVAAFSAVVLVIPVRYYVAYALGAVLVASVLVPLIRDRARLTRAPVIRATVVIVAVVTVLVGVSTVWAPRMPLDTANLAIFRGAMAEGGSGVPQLDRQDQSFVVQARSTLRGVGYLLLAPWPWQWSGQSLRFRLALPETLVWWGVFFGLVVPGFWRAVRRDALSVQPFLTFLILLSGLYGLIFGNVGVAHRERAQLVPFLLIVAAFGLRPAASGSGARATPRRGWLTWRTAVLAFTALLPGFLKRAIYRWGFGYRIGRRVRMGLVYLDCETLTIGDDAVLRHGVVFLQCGRTTIGGHAFIGPLNLFRGGRSIDLSDYVHILRLNVFNAIPDHDCTNAPDSVLAIGYGSAVTAGHRFDFTARIVVGRCSTFAGRNSSLWTHSRRVGQPVEVGDYCYIGSETRMAPGTRIPDCCLVGLGAVVVDAFDEPYSLIAGVPAVQHRQLGPGDYVLLFGKTRPDLPDDAYDPPKPPEARPRLRAAGETP